jgi:hypothetical protein
MGTYTYRLERTLTDEDGGKQKERVGDIKINAPDLNTAEALMKERLAQQWHPEGLHFGLIGFPSLEEMDADRKKAAPKRQERPNVKLEMEDLPMKTAPVKPTVHKKRTVAKRPPTARQTTEKRKGKVVRSQTAKATSARPKKALPTYRLPGEQPRDRMGRFASKTGQVLKGAIFGTAHVVGGTVAAAQHGYKTVKGAHKRRKKAAGHGTTVLAGKPKRRRHKRVVKAKPVVKQGFLSKLFGKRK